MEIYDVIIIGAGASGLFAGMELSKSGVKTLILEKEIKAGRKVLLTGGGKSNFTNLNISSKNYYSENEHFVKSALARYSANKFIEFLAGENIEIEERDGGKLFTAKGADLIVQALLSNIDKSCAEILYETRALDIKLDDGIFEIRTNKETFRAKNLIIATGGKTTKRYSSEFFKIIANKFGIELVEDSSGLVPLIVDIEKYEGFDELGGISIDCAVTIKNKVYKGSVLFTKSGFSGPAALNASLAWTDGVALKIDFMPQINILAELQANRKRNVELKNFLAQYLPKRLVEKLCEWSLGSKPLCRYNDKEIETLALNIKGYEFVPSGKEDFYKAETMLGGLSTDAFSSKTMECKRAQGLYAIGEALDVAGELGGYNLHWAWASANAAAIALNEKLSA